MLKTTNETGVTAMADRLEPFVRKTPLQFVNAMDLGLDGLAIALKLEVLQHTGNIKVRAAEAFCQLLDGETTTVVSACPSDDAIAMAYVARMRSAAPDLIFDQRADVLHRRAAKVWARRHGAAYYDPVRSKTACTALGTIGVEIEGQLGDAEKDVDTWLVPVNSGATLAGLCMWSQGRVRLVGVESIRAPALYSAVHAGRPLKTEVSGITARGCKWRRVAPEILRLIEQFVSSTELVSDAAIVEAQYLLWRQLGIAVSPKSALSLAALISGAYVKKRDERIGLLLGDAHLGPLDWDLGL